MMTPSMSNTINFLFCISKFRVNVWIRMFANLGLTNRDEFLTVYRRLRKEFHGRFDFSRNSLWREVFHYYCFAPETGLLEKWETDNRCARA